MSAFSDFLWWRCRQIDKPAHAPACGDEEKARAFFEKYYRPSFAEMAGEPFCSTATNPILAYVAALIAKDGQEQPQQGRGDGQGEQEESGDDDDSGQGQGDGEGKPGKGDAGEQPSPPTANPEEVAKAVEQAKSAIHQTGAGAGAGRHRGEGEQGQMDPDAMRLAIMAAVEADICKILALLGRAEKAMWAFARGRVQSSGIVMEDIRLGGEIENALTIEQGLLASGGILGLNQMRRFVERGLFIKTMEQETPAESGPVMIMLDVSGSMLLAIENDKLTAHSDTGRNRGYTSRYTVARAIAMACLYRAIKEGRECHLALFGQYIHSMKRVSSFAEALEMTSLTPNCGTSIQRCLLSALDLLPCVSGADVFIATDADGELAYPNCESVLQKYRVDGLRVVSLSLVGYKPSMARGRILDESGEPMAQPAKWHDDFVRNSVPYNICDAVSQVVKNNALDISALGILAR